jgi:hypothetical protein
MNRDINDQADGGDVNWKAEAEMGAHGADDA